MDQDDTRILKVGLPFVLLLILLGHVWDTANLTGFMVYDTDFVSYDPLNPEHIARFKELIDARLADYEPYAKDAHHLTFGCARTDGKIIIESLNVALHGHEGIIDQATTRCVGRIYWRGAHR